MPKYYRIIMSTIWVFVFIAVCRASPARKPNVEPEFLNMLRSEGRHEEFAKYLGLDVSLVLPVEGKTEEEILFSSVSSLGDILLTPEQEEQARQGIRFEEFPANRWPNNEIPYSIMTADYNIMQMAQITSAIATFNTRIRNLRLVRRSNQDDYVVVMSGNGCYSNLGKRGGMQPISLQKDGCLVAGTIQHEFIHAAGFLHEHSRPDRDDYVKVLYENIPQDLVSQYEKESPEFFGIQGPYDPYSVMHYSYNAPNGKPAFEFYDKSVNTRLVGQRVSPTDEDIQKINTLYS